MEGSRFRNFDRRCYYSDALLGWLAHNNRAARCIGVFWCVVYSDLDIGAFEFFDNDRV